MYQLKLHCYYMQRCEWWSTLKLSSQFVYSVSPQLTASAAAVLSSATWALATSSTSLYQLMAATTPLECTFRASDCFKHTAAVSWIIIHIGTLTFRCNTGMCFCSFCLISATVGTRNAVKLLSIGLITSTFYNNIWANWMISNTCIIFACLCMH